MSATKPTANEPRLLARKRPGPRYRTLPGGRQVIDDRDRSDDVDRGYTSNPAVAMRGEPEAVDADYQERLSARAHRDAYEQRLEAYVITRAKLARERDFLEARVRYVRRQIARLDAKWPKGRKLPE